MGQWRRHSKEFKKEVVEKMKNCTNITNLARDLGLERKLLYTWKHQFEGRPEPKHANYLGAVAPETTEKRLRDEIRSLKEALGQKTAEIDFFANALRRVNPLRQPNEQLGEARSTPKSGRRPKGKAN